MLVVAPTLLPWLPFPEQPSYGHYQPAIIGPPPVGLSLASIGAQAVDDAGHSLHVYPYWIISGDYGSNAPFNRPHLRLMNTPRGILFRRAALYPNMPGRTDIYHRL